MLPTFRRTDSPRARSCLRRSSGFTLLELIVVMLIIAVSAALVAPSVTSGRRQREVRHTLQAVQALVRRGAATAVFRRKRVELRVDPDRGALALAAPAPAGGDASGESPPAEAADGEEADGFEIVRELVLPPAASVDDLHGGRLENDTLVLEFFPTGGSSGGGFELRFADGPGGRVRQRFAVAIDPLTSEFALEEGK